MKYFFGVLIFIHGILHFTGFLQAFHLADFKELSLPINKFQGILWLIAGLLILLYAFMYLRQQSYSYIIGFIAAGISTLLIIYFWKDAKFGMLLNLLIFGLSLISFGTHNFNQLVRKETSELISGVQQNPVKVVTEDDIKRLPPPVQQWLLNSGMVGKPYITVGKVIQQAEMKMKPTQEKWLKAGAVQYSFMEDPEFIWSVDVKMNRWLNFRGRDKLINGKGEMLIKLNSLFNVVNEKGSKLNEGSMQRYLGEMVWFPSLALSENISWEPIDPTSAKATLKINGTTASGIFYFNANGDFTRFFALRFKDNTKDAQRYEWILEVLKHQVFEGIKIPSEMTATWKLPEGDWTWLKLKIIDIQYNDQVNS